jgi:hypothetical protein
LSSKLDVKHHEKRSTKWFTKKKREETDRASNKDKNEEKWKVEDTDGKMKMERK